MNCISTSPIAILRLCQADEAGKVRQSECQNKYRDTGKTEISVIGYRSSTNVKREKIVCRKLKMVSFSVKIQTKVSDKTVFRVI
jgi:hypothetical protein